MPNDRQLEILKKGAPAWNEWRARNPTLTLDLAQAVLKECDLQRVDLSAANLCGANLSGTNFNGAYLGGANLVAADLRGTHLVYANLSMADLSGANLVGANLATSDLYRAILSRAILSGAFLGFANLGGAALDRADLSSARLNGANFSAAHLAETIFTKSIVKNTLFADVDLSGSKGLETIHHEGPSSIGIDTIYLSGGNIPEVFLRGCGVPDDFITYAKSLVGKPIEYYSCFISYSTLDQEFAKRIHADLQAENVRCWFAPHDIQGGRKIHEQIDEAIRHYDKLLLILSERSMNSEWVRAEISKARKREAQENCRMLFPIRLIDWNRISEWECFDADRGKDSAREIREYYVPDFSLWKTDHDKYSEELGKLLRDLKGPSASK